MNKSNVEEECRLMIFHIVFKLSSLYSRTNTVCTLLCRSILLNVLCAIVLCRNHAVPSYVHHVYCGLYYVKCYVVRLARNVRRYSCMVYVPQ